MFKVIVENFRGERLQLTQNPDYNITTISGLNPPKANINTATNATFDGSVFKSSKVNERNIVLNIVIERNIERNRIALYKYFPTKKNVRMTVQNGTRDVFIIGYVESFEINQFDRKQVAQVSLICPKGYFSASEESVSDMSAVVGLFEFPFYSNEGEGFEFSEILLERETNIVNIGDVATGLVIRFHANGEVSDPSFYNVTTGAKIKVNIDLAAGDDLIINTNKGEKSVTLVSAGVSTNVLNDLDLSSEWLLLEPGDNIFLYTAENGGDVCECFVSYNVLYEGV